MSEETLFEKLGDKESVYKIVGYKLVYDFFNKKKNVE